VITRQKTVASSPGVKPFTGQIVPENQVTFSLSVGKGTFNLYAWQLIGSKTVKFTWKNDDNANRRAVLDGIWTRAG
jgi:hypothetical protein